MNFDFGKWDVIWQKWAELPRYENRKFKFGFSLRCFHDSMCLLLFGIYCNSAYVFYSQQQESFSSEVIVLVWIRLLRRCHLIWLFNYLLWESIVLNLIENWPNILIQDWRKWAQIGVITGRRFISFQLSKKCGFFENTDILNPSPNLTVQFNATHSIITEKNVNVKQLLGLLFVFNETLCDWNTADTT